MNDIRYKGYTREQALDSVGAGWAGLVNTVFDTLEHMTGTVKVVQVKEKYAGLRIYTDYINAELDKVIGIVSAESFKICETCGASGKVRGTGWYYTSCDIHAKKGDVVHKVQPTE